MHQDQTHSLQFVRDTANNKSYATVHHGDTINLGRSNGFSYKITDPYGIHARPAGQLAEIVKTYDCEVTVRANGRSASAKSPIELMNLDAGQDSVLFIKAAGNQSEEAIQAVKDFLRENL